MMAYYQPEACEFLFFLILRVSFLVLSKSKLLILKNKNTIKINFFSKAYPGKKMWIWFKLLSIIEAYIDSESKTIYILLPTSETHCFFFGLTRKHGWDFHIVELLTMWDQKNNILSKSIPRRVKVIKTLLKMYSFPFTSCFPLNVVLLKHSLSFITARDMFIHNVS